MSPRSIDGSAVAVSRAELRERRVSLTGAWESFVHGGRTCGVRSEVVASWHRSARHGVATVTEAPVDDPEDARQAWVSTPFYASFGSVEDDLVRTADRLRLRRRGDRSAAASCGRRAGGRCGAGPSASTSCPVGGGTRRAWGRTRWTWHCAPAPPPRSTRPSTSPSRARLGLLRRPDRTRHRRHPRGHRPVVHLGPREPHGADDGRRAGPARSRPTGPVRVAPHPAPPPPWRDGPRRRSSPAPRPAARSRSADATPADSSSGGDPRAARRRPARPQLEQLHATALRRRPRRHGHPQGRDVPPAPRVGGGIASRPYRLQRARRLRRAAVLDALRAGDTATAVARLRRAAAADVGVARPDRLAAPHGRRHPRAVLADRDLPTRDHPVRPDARRCRPGPPRLGAAALPATPGGP